MFTKFNYIKIGYNPLTTTGCMDLLEAASANTNGLSLLDASVSIIEPRSEKTGLRGFRPGPTQIGLCSHRICLEA